MQTLNSTLFQNEENGWKQNKKTKKKTEQSACHRVGIMKRDYGMLELACNRVDCSRCLAPFQADVACKMRPLVSSPLCSSSLERKKVVHTAETLAHEHHSCFFSSHLNAFFLFSLLSPFLSFFACYFISLSPFPFFSCIYKLEIVSENATQRRELMTSSEEVRAFRQGEVGKPPPIVACK